MKTKLSLGFFLIALASLGQNWQINLNSGSAEPLKFGTYTSHPIDFYANNRLLMSLGTNGSLRLDSLAGSGRSLLFVDENGSVGRQPSGAGGGAPCISPTWPWSQGGNNYPIDNSIGTCSSHDFVLKSNDSKSVFLKTNGYVGIGLNNSNPAAPFDLSDGNNPSNTDHLHFFANSSGVIESTGSMNLFFKSSGNFLIQEGDYSTSNSYPRLRVNSNGMLVYNNFTTYGSITSSGGIENKSNADTDIALKATNTTSAKTNFKLFASGKVQMGTQANATNAAFLTLNLNSTNIGSTADNAIDVYDQTSQKINFRVKASGFVYAKELNIQLTTFPDYVFNTGYNLLSLESLNKYIQQYKHLPNVPTAAQIEKDGANLGEMSRIQMEKIEELTLYIIDLKKEIDGLKKLMQEK